MKKILMIVQNDFVNDSRIIKEANSLGEQGYKVLVLALYKDGLLKKENFDHFTCERMYLETREKLGKGKFSQIFKFSEFKKKCVLRALEYKPDYVHCHDVYTLPIGNVICRKLKKVPKLIYDSHELWREASNNATMPKVLLNFQNSIEKRVIKKCDAVITVSNSIGKYLKDVYKLNKQPYIIRNIPHRTEIVKSEDIFRKMYDIKMNQKIILYQGLVSDGRGIEKVIAAMKTVKTDCVFIIMGNGDKVNYYKELAEKEEVSHKVFFHEAVPSTELLKYTASADLGVSIVLNICLSYYYCLPNKMFEYIQASVPVLCSNYPDMEEIINKYQVGEATDPLDSCAIAEKIDKLFLDENEYEKYKRNCKSAKEELNWEKEQLILRNIYSLLS